MIYVCEKCHFTFERAGKVEDCPDCGKMSVRQANEEEIKKTRVIYAHDYPGWYSDQIIQ